MSSPACCAGHGGGGVRPIGMKKYPDARQAAVAYDEQKFRENGYDAVLNFDADNYRVSFGSSPLSRANWKCRLASLLLSCMHLHVK